LTYDAPSSGCSDEITIKILSADARSARILIVEPDSTLRAALGAIAGRLAQVNTSRAFPVARTRLRSTVYDLLVTNVRLKDYNGLHLVYLVKLGGAPVHAVVYGNETDLGLASEVRRAGAFYEVAERLPITLPTYISAALPPADRRTSTSFDRRTFPRGGRRRWDRYSLDASAPPLS
jgi:DNA-binding NtrC family response regulator